MVEFYQALVVILIFTRQIAAKTGQVIVMVILQPQVTLRLVVQGVVLVMLVTTRITLCTVYNGGGGGGGWGASGGNGYGASGGSGGKAIEDNGYSYSITNNGTVYGALT